MNEQWQELKETITEMRDNNGTGTQQEVCKFLVNYMEILEKQMQEPKTGHWIDTGDYPTGTYVNVECSCCHEYSLEKGDYCPNCGAKMIEPQESEEQEKVDDYRDILDELEREEYYESKYGKEQE